MGPLTGDPGPLASCGDHRTGVSCRSLGQWSLVGDPWPVAFCRGPLASFGDPARIILFHDGLSICDQLYYDLVMIKIFNCFLLVYLVHIYYVLLILIYLYRFVTPTFK